VPHVVPHELVKVAPRHFISDELNIYRPRLDRFWSEEEINEIEVEQRDLIKWYNNDQHIEHIINLYKHTVSFNEAWTRLASLSIGYANFAVGWQRLSQTQHRSNRISPF